MEDRLALTSFGGWWKNGQESWRASKATLYVAYSICGHLGFQVCQRDLSSKCGELTKLAKRLTKLGVWWSVKDVQGGEKEGRAATYRQVDKTE